MGAPRYVPGVRYADVGNWAKLQGETEVLAGCLAGLEGFFPVLPNP